MKKKLLAFIFLFFLLMTFHTPKAYAATYNEGTEDEFNVKAIEYRRNHDGTNLTGGTLDIDGGNLAGRRILFQNKNTGTYEEIGTRLNDEASFVQYSFTYEQVNTFSGKIRIIGEIEAATIELPISDIPYIQEVENININTEEDEDLVLKGTNFDTLLNDGVTMTYGRVSTSPINYDNANDSYSKLTVEDIIVADSLGFQDITIEKEDTLDNGIEVTLRYQYNKAFRLLENVGLVDVTMYPNTTTKGGEIYFQSDSFTGADYEIYLMDRETNFIEFLETNKTSFVNFDETKNLLTVRVPNNNDFALGDYEVYITKVSSRDSGEIIAFEPLEDDAGNLELLSVVQADFLPNVTSIYPLEGMSTGEKVEIEGSNIISLNIPGLTIENSENEEVTLDIDASTEKELQFNYNLPSGAKFIYNSEEVTITRNISVQIGETSNFQRDDDDPTSFEYLANPSTGDDTLFIETVPIFNLGDDPFRDVVIQINTSLVSEDRTYNLNYRITEADGFKYIPSSIDPIITSITPNRAQVTDGSLDKTMEFSLRGENFLVNEYTEDGTTYLNRPVILIKTDNNQTESDYDIKIDPNGEHEGEKGVIISKKPDDNGETHYPLVYEIINENDQVVTGTEVNEIGERIIFRLPEDISLDLDDTTKNIQVINPSRGSDNSGNKSIYQNLLEFVETTDAPIIDSVEPNLVTIEGGVEVRVTGSNFKEGVVVYLDGKEITGVQREIDSSGNQVVLTFTAPPNRVTDTQLQVMNPSGGIDVADFFYIDSFEKDPIITSFSPEKGRKDTVVSIKGDNFLTANPTVENLSGINVYTMIGTRVKLDGEDVNKYITKGRGIDFEDYILPSYADVPLYDKSSSNIRLTDFKENVLVKDADEDFSFYNFYINQNKDLIVFNADNEYILNFEDIDKINTDIDDLTVNNAFIENDGETQVTTLTLVDTEDDETTKNFNFIMNNQLIYAYEAAKDSYRVKLANYAEDVFLRNENGPTEFYKIYQDYDNEIIITNGQNNEYQVRTQGDEIVALDDSGDLYDIIVGNDKLTIKDTPVGDLELKYITPYQYRNNEDADDIYSDDQYIYGNNTEVISKNQILFKVPDLQTGTGYKDLEVENPDTRSDSRLGTEGFYYRKQSQSNPKIYEVTPNKGSVDGGYTVTIKGDDFNASVVAPTRVFIDGVEVPEEEMVINLEENEIRVKVPAITKDIRGDFGIDELSVPVVVLNDDGGSAVLENGFTYIIPSSEPRITSYNPKEGSANGDTIVEIRGTEFVFYEPYEGNDAYTEGDDFEDLNGNDKWDDLLKQSFLDPESEAYEEDVLPILPKVYFGQQQGTILEYGNGYLKVSSPMSQEGGVKDLYVVNNDLGVSNVVDFSYTQSAPQINSMIPDIGRLQGQENKDLYGVGLEDNTFKGYINDTENFTEIENLDAAIRFGDIDNLDIEREAPNSGLINSGRSTVNLTGGLEVSYEQPFGSDIASLKVSITSNNEKYEREFTNYDQSEVYIPVSMLRKEEEPGEFIDYQPSGYEDLSPDDGIEPRFEFIRVYVDDRRMFVERGYAPEVTYDNKNHVRLKTPAYYTTGTVDVTYVNPDGGRGTGQFTYTNPASKPKILQVQPREMKFDDSSWLVFGTIEGKKQLEIIGEDFRDGASVTINGKNATVIDFGSKKMSDGETYDVLIVQVPQGNEADVDQEYPIIVTNKDFGIANSALDENLLTPIEDVNGDGETDADDKLHYYFVYQKPLSGPTIGEVIPNQTSVAGGNEIRIIGEDFREDAYVIIGSAGGVPIKNVDVDPKGQFIKFRTPTGLTLGPKDVQIINSDYGIDIIQGGLEIISAPETDEVRTEDGSDPKERISIEGGEKIIIKGKFFQEGANVYFGGLWQPQTDEGLQGPTGLYTDDVIHVVENGVQAQNVEYIDSETLLVTTPALEDEDEYSIVVINDDGGITDNDLTIEGREPIPSDPVGLEAELVDDRYIKIYDYYSENVDYYEIYVVIEDDRSRRDLERNNYRDFNYLDTTEIEPYKITDIPGIEDMDDDESLYIVLKAVNKYGPSNWSNIVELDYEKDDLEDIEKFGNPDTDGDLGVPEGESHEVIKDEEKLTVNVASGNYGSVVVDLSDEPNKDNRVINIPSEKVRSDYHYISVNFGDAYLQFSPRSLNTNTFNQFFYRNGEDSYVTVENKVLADDYSALMRSYLPRGRKPISPVQEVSARVRNNTTEEALDQYNSPLDFGLYYNSDYLRPGQNIGIYRFDESNNTWEAVETTENETLKVLTTKVLENGYYVILKY
jgi:hypothetical protein